MRREAGFTLLELAFVVVVLVAIITASVDVLGATGDALATGITAASLDAKANRVVEQIHAELAQAGTVTLDPPAPAGSPSLAYRRSEGYADGEILWGRTRRIEWRADEVEDGEDNDSDGLVDEGSVVWLEDPGQPTERLVTWAGGVREYLGGEAPNGVDDNGNGVVDEPGLSFQLDGDAVVVAITVAGRDPKGRLLVRSASTAVRLRN